MELWKVCRAINNPIRLEMLRFIAQSPGQALNVVQVGDLVGLKKAAASQYLKSLATAGFVDVERSGKFVACSCVKSSMTAAGAIYETLKTLFPKPKRVFALPPKTGWQDELLEKINAFSFHVRISILRELLQHGLLGFEQLQLKTKLPPKTLKRQLGLLISAGVVEPQESTGAGYSLSTIETAANGVDSLGGPRSVAAAYDGRDRARPSLMQIKPLNCRSNKSNRMMEVLVKCL